MILPSSHKSSVESVATNEGGSGRSPEGCNSRGTGQQPVVWWLPVFIVKTVDMKAGVSRTNRLIRLKMVAGHKAWSILKNSQKLCFCVWLIHTWNAGGFYVSAGKVYLVNLHFQSISWHEIEKAGWIQEVNIMEDNFIMEEREIRWGDIYRADLNPIVGSEQEGYRPVLVIQNNRGNKYSPTVVVAAITSRPKHKMPTHVPPVSYTHLTLPTICSV